MVYAKESKLKTFFGEVLSKHLINVSNSFDRACIFFIFIKFETEFVSKYSLSTRQFNKQLSFYVEKSDTKIHSYMYYFCVCFYFIILLCFLVCIFYLFTACQVRGRFLRPPPPPLPVPSWLTHPFSLIC